MNEAKERIRKLAEILSDPESDSDDLIHAFGDIEELRYQVAAVLFEMLSAHPGESP